MRDAAVDGVNFGTRGRELLGSDLIQRDVTVLQRPREQCGLRWGWTADEGVLIADAGKVSVDRSSRDEEFAADLGFGVG